MDKKEFFKAIANDYFEERSISLNDLEKTICSIMPVFGELKTEIAEEDDNNKTIVFVDVDEAEVVFAPKGYTPTKEDLDMSCMIMKLTINKDNIIQIIEHGLNMFTPANKDIVLFLGSMIGKKIIL